MNITSQSLLNAGTTNELFAADFSDFAAEDAAPEEPSGAMLQPQPNKWRRCGNGSPLATQIQEQRQLGILNAAGAGSAIETGRVGGEFDVFDHQDGKRRRFPPGYIIENCKLQHMYQLWHCGDNCKRICPIKDFTARDRKVWSRKMQKNYSELKTLMENIDESARKNNALTRERMSRTEAQTCFLAGQSGSNVEATIPRKKRNISQLKWRSALRYKKTRSR